MYAWWKNFQKDSEIVKKMFRNDLGKGSHYNLGAPE